MAHVLFATINKIRQKIAGDVNEEKDDPNTKPCHSHLKHLNGLETKSLVGVAIDLGIPIEDAIRIHKDYLILKKTPKVVSILKKHLNSIPALLCHGLSI